MVSLLSKNLLHWWDVRLEKNLITLQQQLIIVIVSQIKIRINKCEKNTRRWTRGTGRIIRNDLLCCALVNNFAITISSTSSSSSFSASKKKKHTRSNWTRGVPTLPNSIPFPIHLKKSWLLDHSSLSQWNVCAKQETSADQLPRKCTKPSTTCATTVERWVSFYNGSALFFLYSAVLLFETLLHSRRMALCTW